LQIPYYFSC